LVIVDEGHNIGTKKRAEAIAKFKKVVGFTATPYRSWGSMRTPEDYGFKVIESLTLPEAQELRLLPPLVGIQINTADLVDEVPTTRSGQIDFAKLEKILKKSPDLRPFIADRVAQIISTENRNYKTVVACNFVWEAQELAELLKAKGIKVGLAVNQQAAREIHTDEIPALNTIDRYKLPESNPDSLQVIISPYVASEGFDAPATEVLVWASPTDSALRYTQYTGRLARRAEGKLFGVVVDCLYQTSQYGWTYNFGMWMKSNVRQLENGLLWLGPERDIEGLKQLPQVEALIVQSDMKDLHDLQKEGTIELQEGEFPIIILSLIGTFKGGAKRLVKIAKEVIDELRDQVPEIVVRRSSWTHYFYAVTDKDKFIQLMQAKGVKLRAESNMVKTVKGEFVISKATLEDIFFGIGRDLRPKAMAVIKDLSTREPDLFVQKESGGKTVFVATDKERFIQEMVTRGVKLKQKD